MVPFDKLRANLMWFDKLAMKRPTCHLKAATSTIPSLSQKVINQRFY